MKNYLSSYFIYADYYIMCVCVYISSTWLHPNKVYNIILLCTYYNVYIYIYYINIPVYVIIYSYIHKITFIALLDGISIIRCVKTEGQCYYVMDNHFLLPYLGIFLYLYIVNT